MPAIAIHSRDLADAQATFSKSKAINAGRIRFEVGGGAFRLVCAIDFPRQIVFVKFLGTHAEYDAIDAASVAQFQEVDIDIRPIRNKADHTAALREIDRPGGSPEGTDDGDRLDILVALVERFEDIHYPVPPADPVGVVRFVMEQNDRSQTDLAAVLGSRSRASKFLNGKRELTLDQSRRLSREWRIPAGALIGDMVVT